MTEPAVCRSCGRPNLHTFLSLGKTPLADALVQVEDFADAEARYPLDVAFCVDCSLVQILEEVPPEQLFVDNYLYFSSVSAELMGHAREHVTGLIAKRGLGPHSLAVEIASNDGYLLRNFVERGIPVLGIDPAPEQSDAANRSGVETWPEFFGPSLARRLVDERRPADVVIANNVMAHVPDLNGFVEGVATILADDGIATIENPYVRDLVDHCEFDTIYHEHHCYFSCTAVDALVRRHGLHLNEIEYFPDLHGGTLRWVLGRKSEPSAMVDEYLLAERDAGLTSPAYYEGFSERVDALKRKLHALLERLRREGATLAAYGAAAKGATMLNVVGIGTDLVEYVVDRNLHKQGRLMPGTHQPILDPSVLVERRPDFLLLLAWNFEREIRAQQEPYRRAGGRFIVPVPEPRVVR
jgi:SAM-dependent methyltransferase